MSFSHISRLLLCLLFLNTCSSVTPPPSNEPDRSPERATQGTPSSSAASSDSKISGTNTDMERLVRLWRERQNPSAQADPPIGPGDVLEVSVPAIEELKVRLVRVSGDGTIALPYIGKLHAAGMTEEQLQDKMVEALHKYMYNPRVSLFVREYRSRQVAVLGAVLKPGLYSVNTGADTILDMISQAGGITSGADPRLYFIPAEEADAADVQKITSTLPQNLMQDPSVMILKKTDPILIDLQELAMGGYQQYLSTSVRPGDVIMVPGGGQVLVEGWVEKPGAYNVTQGLTVSGAVVAAGGPLYPADVTAVKVIRSEKGGKRSFHTVDLEKIKRGEAPDVALKGGDIVEVAASSSKLIPYGLYRFFSTVVNVGIGGTIPFSGS